jgi:ribosome-associated translation inhibitor RaiA
MSSLTPQMRRLLEIAGTLQHHEEEEHRLFHKACELMGQIETFCGKQHEADVYGPIAHAAKAMCDRLNKHFDRYKNMTAAKKKEIENKGKGKGEEDEMATPQPNIQMPTSPATTPSPQVGPPLRFGN